MVAYKVVLKEYHKGMVGGSGLSTDFENWSDEKLSRYDVDIETYDHTDVASSPVILIDMYVSTKVPFSIVIHMWDKKSD